MVIKINLRGNLKKQFRSQGLSFPRKKSSGKFGLKGSTLLDRNTEKESLKATLEFLKRRNIIK